MIYHGLEKAKTERKKKFAVLIDPDKIKTERIDQVINLAKVSNVDYFFLGGSLILDDEMNFCIEMIKRNTNIPVVLFPGSTMQVNHKADTLLFLSLISGRNPDLLIGKHVESAPLLLNSPLEVLPTGYMLIDGGTPTSVQYMSNTRPIPANKKDINFYVEAFGVSRVVLPRVLTIPEITALNKQINVETEVFVFGGLCVMAEGRCALSSYATGESPNMSGVCSPASHVRYEDEGERMVSRLGDFTINAFEPDENAGYPTLCKGRFKTEDKVSYLFEEPTSLNTLSMLPELFAANVASVKIEGRQRSPAYVEQVTRTWRAAIDRYLSNPEAYQVRKGNVKKGAIVKAVMAPGGGHCMWISPM